MNRQEILEVLDGIDKVLYGNHVVVDIDGNEDVIASLQPERIAVSQGKACIALDADYEDEYDVESSLAYVGLYTGQ